jgi:3-deoxy-7-phosphoheptulonate synthase
MLIRLNADADTAQVQAALQDLGLWTEPLRSERNGLALRVLPHSSAVSISSAEAIPGVAEVFAPRQATPRVTGQAGREVRVGSLAIGGDAQPVLAAGPCAVESREQIFEAAEIVTQAGGQLLRGGAYKPRSSPYSFAGHGRAALQWLRDAADAHQLAVVTEVMSEHDVDAVAQFADLLQVGSRNMQNFALLRAVGESGRPVLLKRGNAATLNEWLLAGEHLLAAGAEGVVFCERGLRSFDPSTRNLLDLSAVALLRFVHKQPVLVDPSHAAGRRDLIAPLSRAALAAGAHGLLLEAHPCPAQARSDGAQALSPTALSELAASLPFAQMVTQ